MKKIEIVPSGKEALVVDKGECVYKVFFDKEIRFVMMEIMVINLHIYVKRRNTRYNYKP